MPFVLFIAADLYGLKVNLEIDFPSFPTVGEIIAQSQATFSHECAVLRPAHAPLQSFSVSRLQAYREEDGTWHDLVSPSQVREFSQLYIIQADPRIQDNQQQILPARKPSRPVVAPSPSVSRTPIVPTSPARVALPVHQSTGVPLSSYHSSSPASMPRVALVNQSPPRFHNSSLTSAASPAPVIVPPPTPSSASRFGTTRAPDSVAQQDKIRYVFEEMDRNGNRLVEAEEFRDLLRALNIDFTSATVTDLFRKGDCDRDGVWSMAEFAQFFSAYTTLLDSLYFRLRDVADGRVLQQELAAERSLLDNSVERRSRCIGTAQDGAAALEASAQKLRHSEGDRSLKAARDNELRGLMVQCEDDLRHAAAQRNAAASDYEANRDRENQAQSIASAAQRESTESERRLVGEQQLLTQAQEKERQLQQLLLEAQRETERQHKNVYDSQVGLAHAREREKNAHLAADAAQKDVLRANDRLGACEREVILKNERQKELNKVLNEVQLELTRLAQRVDDDRRDLAAAEERDRANRHAVQEADVAVHQQERRLHEKDQEIILFSQRRAAMELQEKPLLEQEVRLREQRDNLEEKELRLRREAVTYFDSSRFVPGSSSPAPVIVNPAPTSFRSVSPPRR